MAKPARPQQRTPWSDIGADMMRNGNWPGAIEAFTNATRTEKTAAIHHYHLSHAYLAAGNPGKAAEAATHALRLKPNYKDAARQLGVIVASRSLPAGVVFDRVGLSAALDDAEINRDQIAEAAVYAFARSGPLAEALALGRAKGWDEAARALVLTATGAALKDELFLKALEHNVVRMPDLEQLLSAIRRAVLLELPDARFEDKALIRFVAVLAGHCRTTEFVWNTSAAEVAALARIAPDREALLAGDIGAGFRLLRQALYAPIPTLLGAGTGMDLVRRIRPNAIRDLAVTAMAEHADEAARRLNLPRRGTISDETSLSVAGQYAGYPYPRWTSLGLLVTPDDWRQGLGAHFPAERLTFMDRPFEVLIAGCGTGLQAIAAAKAYGPRATVTAIDLSPVSLAYASRMADRFGVRNVSFAVADISELVKHSTFHDRFDVIECVGVLHHMSRPFEGWQSLLSCLAPHGIMLIGLYSEIARRRWTSLKAEPEFPGEHCDDATMRAWRAALFRRPDSVLGAEFKGIRDLYTASGFRDLVLHVSEKRHGIPEIAVFLSENGLQFHGFLNRADFDRLKAQCPQETWPGSLEAWHAYETGHPATFANMYRFWCARG